MMKIYITWNISIIPPVEYFHLLGLLTFVDKMELGFYMASTCFATQIASKNLLNKRTLFAKLKKNTYFSSILQR